MRRVLADAIAHNLGCHPGSRCPSPAEEIATKDLREKCHPDAPKREGSYEKHRSHHRPTRELRFSSRHRLQTDILTLSSGFRDNMGFDS